MKPAVEGIADGYVVATQNLIRVIAQHENPDRMAEESEREIRREARIFTKQSATESTLSIAELMHQRIDRALATHELSEPATKAAVSCRRGCSHCCYQVVSVAEPEAVLAIQAARIAGHLIDIERARVQAAVTADTYNALSYADRRCVMLKDDGDCAIYEDRPAACRSYRVLTLPEQCDTEKHPGASTLAWITPGVEITVSGAMRVFRHGALAEFIAEGNT